MPVDIRTKAMVIDGIDRRKDEHFFSMRVRFYSTPLCVWYVFILMRLITRLTFNLKYSFNALLIDREHLGFKMNGH